MSLLWIEFRVILAYNPAILPMLVNKNKYKNDKKIRIKNFCKVFAL